MTNTSEDLAKKIEQMISEHLTAARKAAQVAVERAFASAATPTRTIAARSVRTPRPDPRPGSTELEALGERFFRAVSRKPGESMVVLAADVGATARQLRRGSCG